MVFLFYFFYWVDGAKSQMAKEWAVYIFFICYLLCMTSAFYFLLLMRLWVWIIHCSQFAWTYFTFLSLSSKPNHSLSLSSTLSQRHTVRCHLLLIYSLLLSLNPFPNFYLFFAFCVIFFFKEKKNSLFLCSSKLCTRFSCIFSFAVSQVRDTTCNVKASTKLLAINLWLNMIKGLSTTYLKNQLAPRIYQKLITELL